MAAGDLSLSITIAAVDQVSSIVDNISKSLGQLPGALGPIAQGAVAVGAALVGIGVSAAQAAGDFQQEMETLVTSAGEAQGNIAQLSDQVLKLSTDTGTSTQQLTQGMYYIESAGYHAGDAIKVMTAAAEGAKAENADLDTVSKALTTTMTDYGMHADQATQAMNGLIAIVQNGKTNLQDLATAMGAVLPVASSIGVSFSQVGGAMAALTNEGVPAQRAAQNFANTLMALAAPGNKAIDTMRNVGLSAQELKNVLVSQGLPEALQLIEDHVGKKFPAASTEYTTALKAILGGITGYRTAMALTGPAAQAYVSDTKKVADAMNQGGDAVLGWSDVQGEFNFQIDRAKQAINAFMIVLGEKLLPLLAPLVSGFTDFVTTITGWIQGINSAGSAGNFFTNILSSLGISGKTAQQIFDDLSTTFHLVGQIASEVGQILMSVFGAALRVAGSLISAFVNGPLGSIIQGLNAVLSFISDFVQAIPYAFSDLTDMFSDLISQATGWGQNFISAFGSGVMSGLNDIVNVVVQVISEIAGYLGFASPAKKGQGKNVVKWGQGLVQGLVQGMKSSSAQTTAAASQISQQIAQQFTSTTIPILPQLQVTSPGATTLASQLAKQVAQQFTNISIPLPPGLQPGAVLAQQQMQAANGDQLNVTTTNSLSNVQPASTLPAGTGNTNPLSSLTKALTGNTGISAAVTNIGNQLSTICSKHATSASKCASDHLTTGLAKSITSKAPAVKSAIDHLGSHLQKLPTHAAHAATKTKKALAPVIPDPAPVLAAVDSIGQAFNSLPDKIQPAVNKAKGITQTIPENIRKMAAGIENIFDGIVNFLRPAFTYMINTIQSQVVPAWRFLVSSVQTFLDSIKQFAQFAVPVIVKGVGTVVSSIGKWIVQSGILKTIWDVIVGTVRGFLQVAASVVNAISNIIISITRWITSGKAAKDLAPIWTAIGTIIQSQLSTMKQMIEGGVKAFQTFWQAIQTDLVPALNNLLNTLKPVGLFLASLVVGIFQAEAAFTKWIATSGILKTMFDVVNVSIRIFVGIIAQIVNAISSALQPVFQQIATTWTSQVKPSWEHLMAAIQPALPFLEGLAKFIGGVLIFVLATLVGAITGGIKAFGSLLTGVVQALGGVVQFVSGLIQTILGIFAFFYDLFTGNWKKLGTDLGVIWQGIVDMGQGLMNAMIGIFSGAFNAIIGFVSGFVQGVYNFFSGLYDDLVGHSIIPDLVNGIMGWFNKLVAFIPNLINNAITFFKNGWTTISHDATIAWSAIVTLLTNVWKSISTLFTNAWNAYISKPLSTLWTNISTWFTTLGTNFSTWGSNLLNMLGQGITNGVHWVTSAVTGVAQTIKNFLGIQSPAAIGPLSKSDQWMPNMMTMFADGITTNTPKVTNATNALATSINTIFAQLNANVTNTKNNVANNMNLMQAAVQGATQGATQSLQTLGTQATTTADQVQTGAQTTNTAMQGTSQVSQQVLWSVTSANSNMIQSTNQVASAHSGLTTKIISNSSQIIGTITKTNSLMESSNEFVAQGMAELDKASKSTDYSIAGDWNWLKDSVSGVIDVLTGKIGQLIASFQQANASSSAFSSQTQSNVGSAVASAQNGAAQIAMILGHSKPKMGPMKDDDQWGKHFVQNLVTGIESGIPTLTAVSGKVAGILATSGVSGGISARISGSPSTAAGVAASNQPMVIHLELDGKPIGKVALQYMQRELRVQGNVRSL